MTLNLIKLCVGVETVDQLAEWQSQRRAAGGEDGSGRIWHTTRMTPKRKDELLEGGSLYWIVKGRIMMRQQLDDLETFTDADGKSRCRLVLGQDLVLVEPRRHRPFQGWRYLKGEDAPMDIGIYGATKDKDELPPHLRAELADLGLL